MTAVLFIRLVLLAELLLLLCPPLILALLYCGKVVFAAAYVFMSHLLQPTRRAQLRVVEFLGALCLGVYMATVAAGYPLLLTIMEAGVAVACAILIEVRHPTSRNWTNCP